MIDIWWLKMSYVIAHMGRTAYVPLLVMGGCFVPMGLVAGFYFQGCGVEPSLAVMDGFDVGIPLAMVMGLVVWVVSSHFWRGE
jgi:hypothetical protein